MRFSAGLSLFLTLAACGGATPAPPPELTTVSVALPSTLLVGATATAAASGRDQNGAAIATGAVAWSAQPDTVATVDANGVVKGLAAGQAQITATAGGKTGSATVTVIMPDALAACRLPARHTPVGLGFPRIANRLKSTGDVRVTVVFVDFSDAAATRTPQDVFAILSPGAADYYRAVSYGKMNLILEPSYRWLRMSKPSTGYGWGALTFAAHKAYIQEALDLATGVDFSKSDAFIVVANPDATALGNGPAFSANPGEGVTAGGKSFENGSTSGHDLLVFNALWLNHEMGHTMSLVDLYAFSGATHRFTGDFSLMGNINGAGRELLGWERWLLGWAADDQVACAPAGQSTATLTPVEQIGGVKIAVAPTGTTSAVVVESRRALGYDATLPNPGLLVYSIDTSLDTGTGVVKVLPLNDTDTRKLTAPLAVGQSLTSGGVTVTYVSQDAAGDHVQITR